MSESESESATDNYEGVFDTHLRSGKSPALILIDFVQAYFDSECPLYADVSDALKSAVTIREAARKASIPVIYTCVVYHESMVNAGRFYEKTKPLTVFKEGSKWGNWTKDLSPSPEELVISKQYPSAFFGTSLAATLTALGVDSVLLAGLTTSGCVRASCVDACSNGFTTFVIEDACGDRHPAPHKANLFDMQAKYAEVINEESTVKYLLQLNSKNTIQSKRPDAATS